MDTTAENSLNRDGQLKSPWQHVSPGATGTMTLTAGVYDCLIVGAGITGLTAALLLQKAGSNVLVADAHNAGFGTTGGTSAHINNFADTTYTEARKAFGEDGAQLFADAIAEGFEQIRSNIAEYNIDCDFKELNGYLYAETEDEVKQLADVYDGMQQVGVEAVYTQQVPVPVPFKTALAIPGQAQFQPMKYLHAIKEAFIAAGGVLLERTPIEKIEQEDGIHVAVSGDIRIRATKVIYATHIPPGINVYSFRCAPYRSYVIAVKLNSGSYPEALIYDSQEPYHYIRTHQIDGEPLLLIGGNDHKTGHDDPEQAFADLEAYAAKYYDVAEVRYRWSSQYYVPADGLPYVGQIPFTPDGILAASGYNGNGMMLGSVSGKILAGMVLGGENKFDKIFSPSRIKPIDGFMEFVKENADVAYRFVADRFGTPEVDSFNAVEPGKGEIVEVNGEKLAVYRDDSGKAHALSPVCTHAGCIVNFNAAECTWDCPCHGGRFAIDGTVLTGPPTVPLSKVETGNSAKD